MRKRRSVINDGIETKKQNECKQNVYFRNYKFVQKKSGNENQSYLQKFTEQRIYYILTYKEAWKKKKAASQTKLITKYFLNLLGISFCYLT
jgi:hypothetical protein